MNKSDTTQKLILVQNLLARATELAIAQKGSEVTVADTIQNLKDIRKQLDPILRSITGQ